MKKFNHSSTFPAPVSQGWRFRKQRTRSWDAAKTGGDDFGDLLYFLHGRQNCKVLQFGSRKDLPEPQDEKCQIYFHLCVCPVLKSTGSMLYLCHSKNGSQKQSRNYKTQPTKAYMKIQIQRKNKMKVMLRMLS